MSLVTVPSTAATDPEDGLPVWSVRPGRPLVPGLLALARLGTGQRCETWRAWSLARRELVVVKLARPHQVGHPRARRSLEREVTALRDRCHPGLPRLHAEALDAAVPHLVLEHVDGTALVDRPGRGRLPFGATVALGAELLAALAVLHRDGLVHLDVKPENVMLRRDGRAVLVDLGSARPLGAAQPAGRPVGTEGYAPPEQEACAPLAAAMDVHALGVTLAEVGPRRWPTTRHRRLARLLTAMQDPQAGRRPTVEAAAAALRSVAARAR